MDDVKPEDNGKKKDRTKKSCETDKTVTSKTVLVTEKLVKTITLVQGLKFTPNRNLHSTSSAGAAGKSSAVTSPASATDQAFSSASFTV